MFPDVLGNPFANKNTRLCLDGKVEKRLLTEAKEAFPYEYSALLAGRGAAVTHYVAMPAANHSRDSFHWDGPVLIHALRTIRKSGLQWLGVLHSHPRSPAVPSSADRAGWHYPELSYWILSLSGEAPDLRVYQWEDGDFHERSYAACDSS
jgi:proteasome lid subunit RPN8/RPN11